MKEHEFLDGLGHIDSDLVDRFVLLDSQLQKKSNKRSSGLFIRAGVIAAACFFLIASVTLVAPMFREGDAGGALPIPSVDATTEEINSHSPHPSQSMGDETQWESVAATPPAESPPMSPSPSPDVVPPVYDEFPEVLIKIEKWDENGFEGTVVDPLISYLAIGDKVSVVPDDQVIAFEVQHPVDSLVIVMFSSFDADAEPDRLFAAKVTGGQ